MNKKIIIAIAFVAVAIVIYSSFNPENSVYFPKCPFHALTGLDCPGCGSQRATHCLLHGQMKQAFMFNPLFVVALPYIFVGIYFEYFGGKQRYPKIRNVWFGKNAAMTVLIVVILFWIGRNIPKFL